MIGVVADSNRQAPPEELKSGLLSGLPSRIAFSTNLLFASLKLCKARTLHFLGPTFMALPWGITNVECPLWCMKSTSPGKMARKSSKVPTLTATSTSKSQGISPPQRHAPNNDPQAKNQGVFGCESRMKSWKSANAAYKKSTIGCGRIGIPLTTAGSGASLRSKPCRGRPCNVPGLALFRLLTFLFWYRWFFPHVRVSMGIGGALPFVFTNLAADLRIRRIVLFCVAALPCRSFSNKRFCFREIAVDFVARCNKTPSGHVLGGRLPENNKGGIEQHLGPSRCGAKGGIQDLADTIDPRVGG